MLLGIQIFGILFALLMIYFTFVRRKRGEFTVKEGIVWLILWVAFAIVTIFPNVLNPIVSTLKFNRTLDLLVVVGFVFLVAVGFYTYSIVRATHKKMEDLVRKVAFYTAEDKGEEDKSEEKK